MTVLILGPNGSGKSAYAEQLVMKLSNGGIYYVATMIPYGKSGQERIEKHRNQRKHMGFVTLEMPFKVSEIQFSPNDAVLLEDVSNLLSNALFGDGPKGSEESVFADIKSMCLSCGLCVLVSIDGLISNTEYNAETQDYIVSLNRLNIRLSKLADAVISMRNGKPVFTKGCGYALD